MKGKRVIVLQGGGFRTSFTAGVLDAFMKEDYNPFDAYIAVSGGTICLSYYLSHQYEKCIQAMCMLAKDPNFMNWNRLISPWPVMNLDYFEELIDHQIIFDLEKAIKSIRDRHVYFVLTDEKSGKPVYCEPNTNNWIDAVTASCAMPFFTKGRHAVNGINYFDGGWSDPLPVEWAYKQGYSEILVIRTAAPDLKLKQSWPDFFVSYIHDEPLRSCFSNNHEVYNNSVDFINEPPNDLKVHQIAPETPLRTGTYSNHVESMLIDYGYGLEMGRKFLLNCSL